MPTLQEIVTPIVAACGLGLSIYNTVQARRDKRPKLQVNVSFGFIPLGPELGDQMIFFEIGNGWSHPITLSSLCIPLSGNRNMALFNMDGEQRLPVALTPGQSTRFWMNAARMEAETIKAGIGRHGKFQVLAQDALGNKYFSKPVSFKPGK